MNPILLSHWLPIWEALELPHISAEEVGRIPLREVLEWDQMPADHQWVYDVVRETAEAGHRQGRMYRWDCCSGDAVKHIMSRPGGLDELREWSFPLLWPILDDPRLFDIASDVADVHGMDADLILWRRRIMQWCVAGGYPVEFRVFVERRGVVGVSSYYPQRDLGAIWRRYAHVAAGATVQLFDDPQVPDAFTADWGVPALSDGGPDAWDNWPGPLLIECGPPHKLGEGAHPCCFAPGNTRGVALKPREGAMNDGQVAKVGAR